MEAKEMKQFGLIVVVAMLFEVPFIFAVPGVHRDDAYIFFRFAENVANGDCVNGGVKTGALSH